MLARLYILSRITYQQTVRHSLYYIVVLVSAALLFVAAPFALFSFGKEINMLKEVGLATIVLANIIIALLSTDFVVTSEIEKQTALITLTKPISRAEFILGKFGGLALALAVATVFLSIIFLMVYWFKEGLDVIGANYQEGRYLHQDWSFWQIFRQMSEDSGKFLWEKGGLFLMGVWSGYLQVMIITALAILLSLLFSLPITAGGIAVFFAIANIVHYFHLTLVNKGVIVGGILGGLIYTLLPNFTNLNLSSLVATSSAISWSYLGLITLYTVFWLVIILTVTVMVFRRYEIK